MDSQRHNYLYLYDLPKDKVSSVKIALAFEKAGIDIGTKKPMIKRDILKPFYSAILNFTDLNAFEQAKKKMKYFNIDDCPCRSLPFDSHKKSSNKDELNMFYKLPKDQDKSILTYEYLEEKFSKYGPIASAKIALNNDSTNKGFAYIQFENKESVEKCLKDLGSEVKDSNDKPKDDQPAKEEATVTAFKKAEQTISPEQSTN